MLSHILLLLEHIIIILPTGRYFCLQEKHNLVGVSNNRVLNEGVRHAWCLHGGSARMAGRLSILLCERSTKSSSGV